MHKKVKRSSLRTDIWVRRPVLFIFLICRMLKFKEGFSGTQKDVMFFLKAMQTEMEDFIMTSIPPVDWILKLSETEEGISILDFFNLPKETKVIQQLKTDIEERNDFPNIPFDKIFGHKILKEAVNNMKSDKKAGIPQDPRKQLVAGLYRITCSRDTFSLNLTLGISGEVIPKFESDGNLSEEFRAAILRFEGGQAILERYDSDSVGFVSSRTKGKRVTAGNKRRKYRQKNKTASSAISSQEVPDKLEVVLEVKRDIPEVIRLVPIADVSRVLGIIKSEAGLDGDDLIAPLIGLDVEDIRYMRKGKYRLNSGHLNTILGAVEVSQESLSQWL